MADDPLTNLADRLKQAAPGLTLDTAFLSDALGSGVALPADLDADLAHAFHPGTDGGLAITLTAGAVQPVSGSTLTVTPVGLTVQSVAVTGATLTFTIGTGTNGPLLDLKIVAPASGWTWTSMSPFATGWPYSWATISGASLTFDTSVGGGVQALSAQLTPPAAFQAIAGLIPGLNYPSATLPLAGQLDFSAVDGATVLFPEGRLEAPLGAGGPLKIFSTLNIQNPRIGLTLPPQVPLQPPDDEEEEALGDDPAPSSLPEDPVGDAPSIDFTVDLMVGTSGTTIPYIWSAVVFPAPGGNGLLPRQTPTGGTPFRFGLTVPPNAPLLTPSAIMGLVTGASYFELVPPELQGMLSSVDLRGFTLDGAVNPTAVRQISVLLGAGALLPWTPLSDDNGFKLQFTDLSLCWSISDPFGDNQQQSVLFLTELELFGGTFTFEITSSLQFDARFDGTLKLSTLVQTLAMNQITLPDGLDAALSDIRFHYDHVAGNYAFSAGVEIDLSFIQIGGKPLFTLTGGGFTLAAARSPKASSPSKKLTTPDATTTIYTGSFGGMVSIVGVYATASFTYQTNVGWQISAALAQPVSLKGLIEEVFSLGGSYPLPSFLPTDLTVDALTVDATRPSDSSEPTTYAVTAAFTWNLSLGLLPPETVTAQLAVDYDGTATSGSIAAQLSDFFGAELGIGYTLAPGGNSTLYATWEGVTATYTSGDSTLTFTLAGWSLGGLITALAKTIADLGPYFTLPAPFDLLNEVSLDGLSVGFGLGDQSGTISAKYMLSSSLELGFATIEGIRLTRYKDPQGVGHKLMLQLIGESPILQAPLIVSQADLLAAADDDPPGVPADELPTADIPGQGNEYFKLCMFAMGQRVSVPKLLEASSVTDVITALAGIPGTDGNANPLIPADGHALAASDNMPVYDQSSDWLIAAHMKILKDGDDWTVDLSFVFHDSDLYGLHLEMAGGKAKALAGLSLDILYKKVTDEIGMYQVDWRFPDAVRNLNFGAVAVVLPDIGVQIYTNGDFLIDIGFPYNMDFSHSFSFSTIIAGVPVTGGGGVYFGKLSGATSTFTPVTTLGTFNPVIVFGVGFQVGLGYSFTAGPLSAGFSLTAFAIFEGVIARWHPYTPPAKSGSSVQRDYYFKVSGTVGVIGLLYGSIDFVIIKASLLVNITLSLTLTYESFQPIDIEASVSVTVSLKVSIDLGLFSISFYVSFHTEVHAGFVIDVDEGIAPWIQAPSSPMLLARTALFARPLPAPLARGRAKPVLRAADAADVLNLYATAAYTVTAAEGVTDPANQTGAFVTLLMMDAPSPVGTPGNAPTSFQTLCQDLLPWLVDHLSGTNGDKADLAAASATTVTPDLLQTYMNLLADLADPPLGFSDYLTFLSSFTVNIQALTKANSGNLAPGSVPFPPFDGLTAAPSLNGTAGTLVDFSAYVSVEPGYRKGIAALFATLAAELEKAGAPPPSAVPPRAPAPAETAESMAAMLFVDMMMLTGRQLMQAAKTAFRTFALALTSANNNIAAILAWSCSTGTADGKGISTDDIVLPNAATPLAGGTFTIPAPPYTILNGDTLNAIAATFQISAAALIAGNPNARVVAAGLAIPVGAPQPFTTTAGLSFQDLATALGNASVPPVAPWTPAQIAAVIGGAANLVAGAMLQLRVDPGDPGLVVAVAPDTTLNALAALYGVTVSAIGAEPANQSIPLFDINSAPTIPLRNITQAAVSDLWTLIVADDQIAPITGMVSRFMTAGLRLPVSTDQGALSLSTAFAANNPPTNPAQQHFGLYQLTGQQFPAAAASPLPASYQLTVSRLANIGPIQLDFIHFDGPGNTSVVDLRGSDAQQPGPLAKLGAVLSAAQAGAFNPTTSFRILPAAARTPKLSALGSGVGFVSADPAAIATLTAPIGTPAAPAARQPMLWSLPSSLLADATERQQALAAAGIGYAAQLPYLQSLQPEALTVDPTTKAPVQTDLVNYAWTTRVEFTVKRLPPPPAGTPLAKMRAFTYELLAPNASQAALLERMVSALATVPASAQPISGIFLAYAQGSGSTAQLLAPADPTSPAFFSRTNLSTETNPEFAAAMLAADAPPPPPPPPPPIGNLANPPEQVVRMLWELSTVRSGGYFLSWDQLPDAAFDSTGKASLTLIVAYQRGCTLTNDRLTAFVNALLTDDANAGSGVQVAVESESAPAVAQPIANASLAEIAALYGLSVGRVAELNADFPLVAGVTIQVGGVTHIITAAEAGATDVWGTIAAEYPPLTGSDISGANSGVAPAAGAALYIPAIAYPTVGGDTLQGIATHYGISIDDLATSAATAPILTSPSNPNATTLAIDPQALDVRPGDASGNVTFELTRSPPDGSGSPESTLEQLYTLLAAGVEGNRFFGAAAGPPFGPQQQDDPMDPGATRAAAVRRRLLKDPAQRRAMLAASTDAPLCYRQALGVKDVATSNVAPAGGTGGLPDGAANPYKGVGTLAQLTLEWRDLFGNVLVDQFRAPPVGYAGPVSGQIVPLLYRDKLIGPAAWPNLAIEYFYKEGALNVTLTLSTKGYEDDSETVQRRVAGTMQDVPAGQAAAARDYALYSRVWYQLNQDYDSAGIPWATGQAVQFSLHDDLLAQPDLPLSDGQAQTFRDFVAQTLAYLDLRRQGQSGTAPAIPALAIPIDVATDVAPGNILPLALTLTLSRQGLLVDSALAGLADGETASIDLLPLPDASNASGSGYSTFAQRFEAMFVLPAGGWTMRVGTSSATGASTQDGDKRTQSLWAVRFADTPLTAAPAGLGFSLENLPLYYAPRPLAQSLLSAKIDLYPSFDSGQSYPPSGGTVSHSFTGVDPNVWFQSVLDAVDLALAPDLAAALYLFDKSTGVADPLSEDGTLGQLLTIKRTLARTIADTVRPILEPVNGSSLWPKPDEASAAAAGRTLCQALLSQLGPAFSTTAIAIFQAGQVAGGPVSLFGKPHASLAGDVSPDGNNAFALSSTRLPLDPSHPDRARLSFLLDSKNQAGAGSASYLPLTLTWEITHVEHNVRSIPGIEDYTDSDWIGFVAPPQPGPDPLLTVPFNNGGEIDVPVLLRALPQPPSMRGQSATATYPSPTVPAELAQWNYEVDFTYGLAAQDTIATQIDLNFVADSSGLQGDSVDPRATALYAALAQFVQVYPAVAAAMTAALDAVTGTDPKADAAATIPVQWFLAILKGVKQAYFEWVHPVGLLAAEVPMPPDARVTFEIELVPDLPAAKATVQINGLAINGHPAALDAGGTTITAPDAGITLPLPFVEIQPDQWTAIAAQGPDPHSVQFNYQQVSPGGTAAPKPKWMDYATAKGIPTRSITMSGLNIFGYRNGTTTLQIRRNEHLLPVHAPPATTNKVFIFSTPAVQFATPVAPSLAFDSILIDNLSPAGSSYQSHLEAFFTGLASGMTGQTAVEAAATVTYSYSLIPGQAKPRTVVPVTLMLHTPAAVSATVAPNFVAPLAAATDLWRTSAGPTEGGDATIDMALALYPAGDGDLQPMLRVGSVSMTAAIAAPAKPDSEEDV